MKRKIFGLIITLVLVVSLVEVLSVVTVSAETYGDYKYSILDDGTIIIDSYYCYSDATELEIPSEINGKVVKSIDDYAFWGCENLTNVKIPESVISIGVGAFYWCHNLVSVTIPNSVTTIGDTAFFGCENLTNITIPDSAINIGGSVFTETAWLENKIKENPLVVVNGTVIDGSTCIGDVTIPNGVTSIEDYAFESCEGLTNITIPNSVTSIGDYVFANCRNLTSITIPKSVTEIGGLTIGYSIDGEKYVKVNNFKIYCYAGTAGEKYAIDNGFEHEILNDIVVTTTPITKPKSTYENIIKKAKIMKLTAKAKGKKINVTWKKISGATGYQLMSATNKKFTKNKKTVNAKKNRVTLKKLKSKKKYFVKVRAFKKVNGKKVYGIWSKVVSKKTK